LLCLPDNGDPSNPTLGTEFNKSAGNVLPQPVGGPIGERLLGLGRVTWTLASRSTAQMNNFPY
jgi:hypothetical protein